MDDRLFDTAFGDLTTTGRTSGQPRTVEMWFAARAGTLYCLAGDRERAHWVRNILAEPSISFRVGELEFTGRGRVVIDQAEAEFAREALVAKYQPGYPEDLTSWRNEALPMALDLDPGVDDDRRRQSGRLEVQQFLAQVRSVLASTPPRWSALAAIDTLELLGRRPAPGEWSAIQCLQHVVDTEASVLRARVVAILDGRDFVAFDPDAEGKVDRIDRTAPELAAELAQMRAESLATLHGVRDEDLVRTARHPELGVVTMDELLNQWAAHDTMHLVQAERAIMQAFIPGSGPWRPYFADHDVGGRPKGSAND